MRIIKYLALMACAVLTGVCGMMYWNPLALALSLAMAAWAGWTLSKED